MALSKQGAIELAQRTANRERTPMVVLNLNPYSPLYVVRDYGDQLDIRGKDLVAVVEPQGITLSSTSVSK